MLLAVEVTMVLILALACSGGGSTESADFLEETVAMDGGELARVAGDAAASGAQVPDEDTASTLQQCFDTWGGCSLCYDLTGGPLGGTYVGALDGAPCSAERTGRIGTQTYTVNSFDLAGTWDGSIAGDYTITATGQREAELLREGQREGRGLDSTFTIDALEATTTSFELATIAVDVTYTGFAGHTWVVHFDGTADDVSGSVTGDNGRTCTILGPVDDLAVICLSR